MEQRQLEEAWLAKKLMTPRRSSHPGSFMEPSGCGVAQPQSIRCYSEAQPRYSEVAMDDSPMHDSPDIASRSPELDSAASLDSEPASEDESTDAEHFSGVFSEQLPHTSLSPKSVHDAGSRISRMKDMTFYDVACVAGEQLAETEAAQPSPIERTAVIDVANVQEVRARWTEAAREAEERAVAEQRAAEEQAAVRRAKEVEAAAAVRRREEKQAAAQQAREQQALEKERGKAEDEEAHRKLLQKQQQMEQRQEKRLRKAHEREKAVVHQAEMCELRAREKAAKIAAMRTVTVQCSCGGELMVTADEMQTLTRYVPNFMDKSAEQLAEILPQLHMGAWLQGTKHLFAKPISSEA